jgi:hypothetical protein
MAERPKNSAFAEFFSDLLTHQSSLITPNRCSRLVKRL